MRCSRTGAGRGCSRTGAGRGCSRTGAGRGSSGAGAGGGATATGAGLGTSGAGAGATAAGAGLGASGAGAGATAAGAGLGASGAGAGSSPRGLGLVWGLPVLALPVALGALPLILPFQSHRPIRPATSESPPQGSGMTRKIPATRGQSDAWAEAGGGRLMLVGVYHTGLCRTMEPGSVAGPRKRAGRPHSARQPPRPRPPDRRP